MKNLPGDNIDSILIEKSSIGFMVFGADGTMIRINEKARSLLECHQVTINIFHENDFSQAFSLAPLPDTVGMDLHETRIDHKTYSINRQRLSMDSHTFLIVELADISARKHRQSAIQKHTSDALRKIRSRITSVQNALSLFTDYDSGAADQEMLSLLRDAQFELWSLSRVAENLRDLLLSTQKNLSRDLFIERFSLKEIIDESIADTHFFQTYFKKVCSFDTTFDPSIMIEGDRYRLLGVFGSIFLNAILYSRKAASIAVCAKTQNEELLVEISDHGIGIPDDDQPHIFEYAFRGSNARSLEPGGSGIDLYIARELLTTMGGRISFESREDTGTKFMIAIPREFRK